MHHLSRILLLSLVANLALGTGLYWRATHATPLTSPVQGRASSGSTVLAAPKEMPIATATWSSFQNPSDAASATHFRDAGFPPAIIRALVAARVKARYADRLHALRPTAIDAYWRRPFSNPDGDLSPEARITRRSLQRQMNEEIKQALGDDSESLDPYERAAQLRDFGPLPSEKVAQIKAINTDYEELSGQIRERAKGVIFKEDRDQLRLLESERRADLVAVLTPAELLEYDLRTSESANTIQSQLAFFNATEEEYRRLTAIRLEFDRRYGGPNLSNPEEARMHEAEKELAAQYQTVFTPERYAEFQLAMDPAYRNTDFFSRRFSYEPTVTRQLVSLQRNINQRADAVRSQPLLSSVQRDAELSALYREASVQLANTLSAKAFEVYQQENIGRWLNQLKSSSTAPTPAKSP